MEELGGLKKFMENVIKTVFDTIAPTLLLEITNEEKMTPVAQGVVNKISVIIERNFKRKYNMLVNNDESQEPIINNPLGNAMDITFKKLMAEMTEHVRWYFGHFNIKTPGSTHSGPS